MLRTAQLITREDPLKLKGRLRKSSDVLFDWAISVLVVVVAVDVEVLELVPQKILWNHVVHLSLIHSAKCALSHVLPVFSPPKR